MTERSARFSLPFILPGQAQKEVFHNEALLLADALLVPAAQTLGDDTPPGDPLPGQCWIVGEAPVAAWTGAAGALACWTVGGWRFIVPSEGMAVWVASLGLVARRQSNEWVVGVVAAAAT